MTRLLEMFGYDSSGASGDSRDWTWLHLNEELPRWLDPALRGSGSDAGGLSAEQIDVLRHALDIERFAAGAFNFRSAADGSSYRERSQAVAADFTPQTRARVLDLTTELGLVETAPPRLKTYDKTLVLGGGYRSPLLRARYAAQLRRGGVALGDVAFLGSPRFLIDQPPESPATQDYAPGAIDEFDLMLGAAEVEFGVRSTGVTFLCRCGSTAQRCPEWPLRDAPEAPATPAAFTHERQAELVDPAGRKIGVVLSASTGRPPYRPDTSDTLRLWAKYAKPVAGQRVLVVTTQVFVPFQTFDSLRQLYLPFGVDIDVVGFGADWGDRPQTAEYLLQETLSAIRSARRLLVAAAEVLRSASLDG